MPIIFMIMALQKGYHMDGLSIEKLMKCSISGCGSG